MKKLFFVLLTICMCMTGCAKKEDGLAWDAVEYKSLDEMNTAAQTNIADVSLEKTEQWYGVISDSIAQYSFNCGDEKWCFRASKDVDNDISGLNYDSIGFEKDIDATYYNDEVYAFRFFYDDVQYVVSLDVKDKDIPMHYFDEVCGEFKTNVTGVKSGYESELIEDGDAVILKTTIFNDDGTKTIMSSIYTFDGDKMVAIDSITTFETEEAAKEYYDLLIENGRSEDEILLDGATISSNMNGNVDFYSDYTKDQFIEMMKSSLNS